MFFHEFTQDARYKIHELASWVFEDIVDITAIVAITACSAKTRNYRILA